MATLSDKPVSPAALEELIKKIQDAQKVLDTRDPKKIISNRRNEHVDFLLKLLNSGPEKDKTIFNIQLSFKDLAYLFSFIVQDALENDIYGFIVNAEDAKNISYQIERVESYDRLLYFYNLLKQAGVSEKILITYLLYHLQKYDSDLQNFNEEIRETLGLEQNLGSMNTSS